MTKPTASDKLEASQIVQRLIDSYEGKHGNEISEGVAIELRRIYARLIKADERLLQPKPKRTRKPKAATADTGYTNPIPRAGRQGRHG